jgi:Skp family chaperone for outer membrane proteins
MAQGKRFVTVNTEQAVLRSDAGKAAHARLTEIIESKKKEFDARMKEIDELKQNLQLVSDESARAQLSRVIQDRQKRFDRDLEDTDRELEHMRWELLAPIIKTARTELAKLVAEQGNDTVIDLAEEPYTSAQPINDITADLIKRINTATK